MQKSIIVVDGFLIQFAYVRLRYIYSREVQAQSLPHDTRLPTRSFLNLLPFMSRALEQLYRIARDDEADDELIF